MNRSERGQLAVVLVTALVVIGTLTVRIILSDGADFLAGVMVGIPVGALLGWVADQLLMRMVDVYTARLRGR